MTPSVEVNGVRLPSVTRVLSAVGLSPDYRGVDPAVLERARLRGTALHCAIQYDAEGSLDESSLHEEIRSGFAAYRRFVAEAQHEPIGSELELVHPTWAYVGHPDRVGWINGRTRTLIDFKHQDSVDFDYVRVQLAGYSLLWAATHPEEPLAQTAVVQLRRDGTYRLHVLDVRPAEQVFLAALVVYRERQRRGLLLADSA